MIERVRQSIQAHGLLQPGGHVLVAVSGGADSVALLLALRELSVVLDIHPTAVHLNHRIRGRAADEDAAFVTALAHRLGVPCRIGGADVPGRARRKGISLEMAAREARYAFFADAARHADASVVATAHTADDQAETVLLKLARGAGPGGLGGIPRVTRRDGIEIVRPMLDVTRAQVLAFLRRRDQPWREDASNCDLSMLRNRVRHEVLPLLEARLNPAIRQALLRTADVLAEEDRWLEVLAGAAGSRCRRPREAGESGPDDLDLSACRAEPVAAIRRVIRTWLVSAGMPPEVIDYGIVARIVRLIDLDKGSGTVVVSGRCTVRRCYDRLRISLDGADTPCPGAAFRQTVRVPGETLMLEQGWRIETRLAPGVTKTKGVAVGALPTQASISRVALGRRRLTVRSWHPGDRMRPLGLDGSKKIQDVFVDAKVPASLRGRVPLFVCGGDIVWLPGYRVARGWEVAPDAATAIQITIAPLT